jgi:hypothetical protein
MANVVDVNTLHDGERNAVFHIRIEGDGSGDEAASALIDISTLKGAPSSVKIRAVDGKQTGFSSSLLWDATTDELACEVPAGTSFLDADMYGGIINKAGSGVTGDINITTVGLGSGDNGVIVLEVRKKFT